MAYETAEGTPYLSYGELNALAHDLHGNGAGIQTIFEGEQVSNQQAQAILNAARVDATTKSAHALIDTGLARLGAKA